MSVPITQTRRGMEAVVCSYLTPQPNAPPQTSLERDAQNHIAPPLPSGPDHNQQDLLYQSVNSNEPCVLIGLYANHLACSGNIIHLYAQQCAYEEGSLVLIHFSQQGTLLTEWNNSPAQDRPPLTTKPASLKYIDNISSTLDELSRKLNIFCLNWDSEFFDLNIPLLQLCDQLIVFCTPRPEDIVASYKVIKHLNRILPSNAPLSVFISDIEEEEHALHIYEKLARTAHNFLNLNLLWAGHQHIFQVAINQIEHEHFAANHQTISLLSQYLTHKKS